MRRKILAPLAIVLALLFGVITSGAAQAATWVAGDVISDSDNTRCGVPDDGSVTMRVKWDQNTDTSPHQVRLNSGYDIAINNNSGLRLPIMPGIHGSQVDGSIFYETNRGPAKVVSAYRYAPGQTIYVAPHSTEIFSADNPDRWVRSDTVVDADPSPHGTAISASRDPFMELSVLPQFWSAGWNMCNQLTIINIFNDAA
jgi:hypothetical protein